MDKWAGLASEVSTDKWAGLASAIEPAKTQSQFDKRNANMDKIAGQAKAGELDPNLPGPLSVFNKPIGNLNGMLQTAGQIGGMGLDVVGNAMSVPFKAVDFALHGAVPEDHDLLKQGEKAVGRGVSKIAQSAPVQSAVKKYGEVKKAHPAIVGDAEAIGNIASLVLPYKGSSVSTVAGNAAKDTLEASRIGATKAGTALERSGKSAIQKKRGEFLQDLLTPKETAAVKEAQFANSKETGLLKSRVVQPTAQEQEMMDTVGSLPVSKNKSLLKNYIIIRDENQKEAGKLANYLKKNDVPIADDDLLNEFQKVEKDIGESPYISKVNGKDAANSVLSGALKALSDHPRTASGLLQARKDFDQWVRLYKGDKGFDPSVESAATMAIKRTRQAMNNVLDKSLPDAGIKKSLRKQFLLYEAMDNLESKGGNEAKNMLLRLAQKAAQSVPGKTIGGKLTAGGLALGGLGAGTALLSAPVVGTGLALYGTGKALTGPTARKVVGKALQKVGK